MARPEDEEIVQKTEGPSKSKDQLDDECFAANASKSAALSHIERPLSVEEQRDIEYTHRLRQQRRAEAGGEEKRFAELPPEAGIKQLPASTAEGGGEKPAELHGGKHVMELEGEKTAA